MLPPTSVNSNGSAIKMGEKEKEKKKNAHKIIIQHFVLQGQEDIVTGFKSEFSEFVLVVENEDVEVAARGDSGSAGSFQLLGDVLTRFSDHCTNTVTQTSDVGKTEIQVKTYHYSHRRVI